MKPACNSTKTASIVIPNYNGRDLLEKNIPHVLSAARHWSAETEVVVVDDASTDGSAEYLGSNFSGVRLLKLEQNIGFAGACDHGIRAARGDVIILLNTDVRVREDFVGPLVSHFGDEDVFAVMSMSFADDGHTLREVTKVPFFRRGYLKFVSAQEPRLGRAITNGNNRPIYSFYAVGAHCAIDKSKYLSLGGFDDFYYPFYSEDVDLCYRAWKRGWKTVFEPRSVVYHSAMGPIRNEYAMAYRSDIIRRNRILFVWKNITSTNYFYLRHLIPTLLRVAGGIFVLDFNFYRAFFGALSLLSQARDRRGREKNCERRLSDKEIFIITRALLDKTV